MATISLAPPLPVTRLRSQSARVKAPTGFGASTCVRTLIGWQPVATLMAGDLVLDEDGNMHELRGIRRIHAQGSSTVRVARKGRAPMTIGGGQPLCADDWRTQILFGQPTVSPAARLVDGVTFRAGRPGHVTLYQLEFDSPVCLGLDGARALVKPVA